MVEEKNNSPKQTINNCQSTIAQQLTDKSIQSKYVPMVASLLMTCRQYVSNLLQGSAMPYGSIQKTFLSVFNSAHPGANQVKF